MAGQGDYVHKIWSLSSQRFLELELPEDAPSEKEQGKKTYNAIFTGTGKEDLSKITFKKKTLIPHVYVYYLVFQKDSENYSMEIDEFGDDTDVFVKRMKPDKPPNPSITFIPQKISNGPFSALLAVKPAWTSGEIERYVNNKSCEKKYLCSRCDGTLALKSNNTDDKGLPLNPHPDIFFLEIDG